MSQKESEWEGELKELLTDYKDAEISWGYGDPEDVTNAIGDIKDFIRQTIDTAVSNREKEIAKEVEKGIISRDGFCKKAHRDPCEGCAYNSGINDALNNVLSILKHQ